MRFLGRSMLGILAAEAAMQIRIERDPHDDGLDDAVLSDRPLRTEKKQANVNTANGEPAPQVVPPSRQVRRQMERQAKKGGA